MVNDLIKIAKFRVRVYSYDICVYILKNIYIINGKLEKEESIN